MVHVLATGSNSGYTVVWDLKSKREVTALSYAGAAPTGVGANFGQSGWGGGGKRGVSAVQWHPDNPTKLATASDDDHNPVIMLWDLRNWKEPEKILTGHDKGILSLSWCSRDSDLLLSSGKDGRTIGWNPSSGEIVAEVTPSSNWSFDTQWCPRNPSVLSTASLDGKISLQSLQSTRAPDAAPVPAANLAPGVDGADIFSQAVLANAANHPTLSLKQAPKWLRRPVGAVFGFGGKLVRINNGPQGATVSVDQIVGEKDVVERALRLDAAADGQDLASFCEQRSKEVASVAGGDSAKSGEVASWKLLGMLFGAEAKTELVTLLGFSKEETRAKVEAAVKALGGKLPLGVASAALAKTASDDATAPSTLDGFSEGGAISDSIASESTKVAESEVTEPSLFGNDDNAQGNTNDFFSQIGQGRPANLPEHVFGRDAAANSSVAATIGSSDSVASLSVKPSTPFRIYSPRLPTQSTGPDQDVDRLITQSLVLGDFAGAVELALATDRFADAILLAVRGGPELLASTQKAYFERQTASLPYLRVLQAVVGGDLTDVVQNADLAEWEEIFVVLCTFAAADEFPGLAELLGQRLEAAYATAVKSRALGAGELRKNAILCYLAASKLEKVVSIWIEQMDEDEDADQQATGGSAQLAAIQYAAHAKALQAFVEKVTVFQQAVGYVDSELNLAPTGEPRAFKLAALYERYVEYAELLAAQGLVTVALRYIALTPADFKSQKDPEAAALTRDRIARATGRRIASNNAHASSSQINAPALAAQSNSYGQSSFGQQAKSIYSGYQSQSAYSQPSSYAPAPSAYPQPPAAAQNAYARPPVQGGGAPYASQNRDDPYGAPTSNPYALQPTNAYAPPAPATGNGYANNGYNAAPVPPSAYAGSANPYGAQSAGGFVPSPPAIREGTPNFGPGGSSVPPPPPRQTVKPDHGWNDAPQLASRKPPTVAAAAPKPSAITSPFPSMPGSPAPQAYGQNAFGPGGQVPPPPPSRGSNRTPGPGNVPPPPRAGMMSPPPPPGQQRGGNFAPPPPQGAQQRFAQSQQPGQFRGAPTPPPGAQGFPRPQSRGPGPYAQPPLPNQSTMPPPPNRSINGGHPAAPQAQQQGAYSPQPPSGPYAPQPQANAGPYAPQPGQGGPPGPPGGHRAPSFNQPPPPGPSGTPQPAPAPARAEPPKPKYPPGDRTHVAPKAQPIVQVLTAELGRLRQVAPPGQHKMVSDTEKRLNLLFDMLNCGTLSDKSVDKVLEIVDAIKARDQQRALELHLGMLTGGGAGDTGAFQAALKLVIQRMGQ